MAKQANSNMETETADQPVEVTKAQNVTKIPRAVFTALAVFAMSFIMLAIPVQAATPDINLTWVGTMFASLVGAFNLCAAPVQELIEAWFPVVIEIVVYGGIIAVIGLIIYAVRGVIMTVIHMLESVLNFSK
jgi:hypothetical protein